jgi:RHS repeat-associated protein
MAQRKTSHTAVSQTLYGLNSLNEITNTALGFVSGTWSATIPVSGSTTMPATNLTVNGVGVAPYQDNTFAATESVTNGLNVFTAVARDVYGRSSSNTVSVTVIPTNTAYSYDLNGNLLSDGTRNFGYDDENELIAVWQANAWSNNFVYDGKMRRRIERDYIWNTGTSNWLQTNEVHFIYDGNLAVQERNASNLPQVTYTRGKDLSGSLQGAGGIGGLLARTDNTKLMVGDPTALAYYHSDGNGNITCLMTPYQQLAAKYLYDTYGNTLATYGSLATANRYRFSSKEWNGNSGLYYYLYRFYDPNLQRWPNRDPLMEIGGINLYEFAGDNPVTKYDKSGLILGTILSGLQNFVCPHTGSGCQLCCAASFQAALIADLLEAGGIMAGGVAIGPVTLGGGTAGAITVGLLDLALSHANDIKGLKDCLDSCPQRKPCDGTK